MNRQQIDILIWDGVVALDVIGPMDVFRLASALHPDQPYEVRLVGASKDAVVTLAGGLRVLSDVGLRQIGADVVLVPGTLSSLDVDRVSLAPPKMLRALQRRPSHRLASVCTGAFSLAAAGFLDGKRATTHWAWAPRLKALHPKIDVDDNRIFVVDDHVWTSAGVTSGIDLALAMVQTDCGPALARQVAQMLVMFVQRPGGQHQFSAHLQLPLSSDERIAEVQAFAQANLRAPLTVPTLAKRAGMSERHFTRTFRSHVGHPPSTYVEALRVDEACTLLLRPGIGVEQAATTVGFNSAEVMRRAFHRRLSTSPEAWRDRFSTSSNQGASPC